MAIRRRKFTHCQKEAVRVYYLSQRAAFKTKSKIDCLDAIIDSVRNSRNICDFSACGGTMWFTWKLDKSVTTHSKRNWWVMKNGRLWH